MNNDQWEMMRADASDIAVMMSVQVSRSSGLAIDARPDAPDTWETLRAAHEAALYNTDWTTGKGGYLPIYDGHTDKTIYTSPEANIMARFWHDMTHLTLNRDFTRSGETAVATQQYHEAWEIGTWLDIPAPRVAQAALLIYRDTVAQVDYAERFGDFPDDQAAFIRDSLENGTRLALMHVAQVTA